MRGRGLGRGRLRRQGTKGDAVYIGDWQGADGTRHRKVLSSDRRVAERLLAEEVRKRDLALTGMLVEEGGDLTIEDLLERYVADLATRTTASHSSNARTSIRRVTRATKARLIRDLRPDAVLDYLR
jgi:hypothetical protein